MPANVITLPRRPTPAPGSSWETYCKPSAIERAEACAVAVGDAERRASALMWAVCGQFDPAFHNLHQLLFVYRWAMHNEPEDAAVYRRQLRRAIAVYRHHRIAETRGIDTSAPGWRGGRAV